MASYKRPPTKGLTIQMALRGHTLWSIAEAGTIMKAVCQACPNVRLFPPLEIRTNLRYRPLLELDVIRFAEKLRCGKCRSNDIFLTIRVADWNL